MRSWVRRVGLCVIATALLATGSDPLSFSAPSEETEHLDVRTDPAGGVRAIARVIFPVKSEVIHAILTDYPKWPELFETRMRVASLTVEKGVATTDLLISHALLPGERRLVSESKTLPGGGLVTDLKGGDFKRYHRVWKLSPMGHGTQTNAEFELVVEIDTMLPDWLVAMAMRQELETHFRIVKEKALERIKQER